jgi:thiol:disulfide interchange protein
LGGAQFFLAGKFSRLTPPGAKDQPTEGIAWKPFSQKALDDLLPTRGVDFTADWCRRKFSNGRDGMPACGA